MRNLIRVIPLFIFKSKFPEVFKSKLYTMVSKGVVLHICKEEAINGDQFLRHDRRNKRVGNFMNAFVRKIVMCRHQSSLLIVT
jgi:hypothetical protein